MRFIAEFIKPYKRPHCILIVNYLYNGYRFVIRKYSSH